MIARAWAQVCTRYQHKETGHFSKRLCRLRYSAIRPSIAALSAKTPLLANGLAVSRLHHIEHEPAQSS